MLNELEELRHSLASHGVPTEAWHPWIKRLAKYVTLLLELDAHGAPATVSVLSRERAATLRNIQPDNQKSFPAFNLYLPLFDAPAGVTLNQANLKTIADAVFHAPLAYKKKDWDRLERLLRNFPEKKISPALSAAGRDPILNSTRELLALLAARQSTSEGFLRQLGAALLQAGLQGTISGDLALDVLFGKLTKKGFREPWPCILYLDLYDLAQVSHRVADPAVAMAWSSALMAADAATQPKSIRCALTGATGTTVGDKMPNPTLPLLGGTYLFSMNPDIPCQTRYGRSSTAIFPVTRHAIQGVNNALRHMTRPELRNRTWGAVPNGTADKSDLLIAYLEQDPQAQLQVAEVLDDEQEEWETEAGEDGPKIDRMSPFAARLTKLLAALEFRNKEKGIQDDHLRLFVLSTIDKGRKQVLFDARYSVDRIFGARERWLDGAANAPEVETLLLQGKGKKPLTTRRHVPSPGAVVGSFREQWIRLGERSQKVSGVSLGRIYKLLLDPDPKQEALWLLERYLPLKLDLFIAAGRPGRNEKSGETFTYTGAALPDGARRDLLITVAVIGILLGTKGRKKETYMNEREFLLGQLLQFADRLHIVYCHGVRNGQVPPQLIGNALLSSAAQSPRKALEVLNQRIPVYERYATQLQNAAEPILPAENASKEDKRLAMLRHKAWRDAPWIKARLADISAELHRLGLEGATGPVGQAELLLGYLAAPEKRKEKQSGTDISRSDESAANNNNEEKA